jgi:hypothetical protein
MPAPGQDRLRAWAAHPTAAAPRAGAPTESAAAVAAPSQNGSVLAWLQHQPSAFPREAKVKRKRRKRKGGRNEGRKEEEEGEEGEEGKNCGCQEKSETSQTICATSGAKRCCLLAHFISVRIALLSDSCLLFVPFLLDWVKG